MIQEYKEKVLRGEMLSHEEVMRLSASEDKQALYDAANEIREHFCGNDFELCSITNARSGRCSEDCKWCSQSAFHKTNVDVYELVDSTEAVDAAKYNASRGVKRHSLVTSGRAVSDKTLDGLVPMFIDIQEKAKVDLCASMGLLSKAQLQRLKDNGVSHFHCNLETAKSYFPKLVTTHTYDEKIQTIKDALAVGLKVCSGGIIGMGESMEQRIELAIALRELGISSIPVNILNAIEGTALEGTAPLNEDEVLTTIALFRFVNPKAKLRFAGGRLQILPFQHKALKAGINAAITGDYLTSTGTSVNDDVKAFTAAGFSIG